MLGRLLLRAVLLDAVGLVTSHAIQATSHRACAVEDAPSATIAALAAEVGDDDQWVRWRALASLGRLGPTATAAVPTLVALLDDPEAATADRRAAAAALRRIDPAESLKRLGPAYDPVAAARADIEQSRVGPGDWPQWGGSRLRNNTPLGSRIPASWELKPESWPRPFQRNGHRKEYNPDWPRRGARPEGSRNIKWVAALGSQTYSNPIVANGRIFIGTNNGAGYLERFPPEVDLGVLLCLDERTGDFLWQHSSEKLPTGRAHDWPYQGVCSTPLVDGERLWFVSNRCVVSCLDTEGFRDGENDGPFRDESVQGADEADVIWHVDMMRQFGVSPHNMSTCCVLAVDDTLLVCTSNGVDVAHNHNLPAPDAPSFVALDKTTGDVLWTDNSPGEFILHGQWASPSYAVIGGQPQVLFPGGDGWLYSFDPAGDGQGRSKLLWKFDCNPKESRLAVGRPTRNSLIAFACVYDGLVYITVGEDPEHGEAPGRLWCIDTAKRLDGSDVSAELAVDADGRPLPRRRIQPVLVDDGERAVPNPDSAVVWEYSARDANGDGRIDSKDFSTTFHRSLGIPVIKDDILYVADFSGLLHCVDANTGEPFWTYDMLAATWGSALLVDDKVYIGDEDGDVAVFRHSPLRHVALPGGEPLEEMNVGNSVYGTPIVANNVLYIARKDLLIAIEETSPERP